MKRSNPSPLGENHDLAFVGEPGWDAASVPASTVRRWLALKNAHGKPNFDVLRRTLNADTGERWMIDFPPAMDAREAELYARPFAHLRKTAHGAKNFPHHPAPNLALRAALARRTRYLATPLGGELEWAWVEPDLWPDDSLLVVARDDDFAHGLLSSRYFRLWWESFRDPKNPAHVVNSFPFPWPADDTGRLTAEQDEAKFALNRAARSGDPDAIDAAAELAYGWAGQEITKLLELHRWRMQNG
ncbi:MAG: hypothetical protein C0518_14960 [Opitutus sp.]|nr:hypothetical protein [Opitutus sp.]